MLKKRFFLVFLFLIIKTFGQTNQLINYSSNNALVSDLVYFCAGDSFNLNVSASQTSTGNYTIQPLTNFIINNGTQLIPFSNKIGNNHFSNPIPIGFTFSFYGQNYNKVVVGSNGRLVFTNSSELNNLNDTTQFTDRTHSGNIVATDYAQLPSTQYNQVLSNPTSTLNLAQIFFGFTDLGYYNQTDYNNLTYANVTYNGKAGLLISFNSISELQTNYAGTISSQVLLTNDNHYIINIVNRNKYQQNAIIGAQDETGTKAVWVPNNDPASVYNNGKWTTSSGNIAYEFVPNQTLTPQVNWFVNNVLTVSNNVNYSNFVPIDASGSGDVLTAKLTYFDGSNNQVGNIQTSSVTFKKLQNPQISAPNYSTGCGNPATLNVINPDQNLTYDWYADTDPTYHQTGTSVNVGTGSYYVQVKNTSRSCSLKSTSQVVNISSVLPVFNYDGQTLRNCDNLGLSSQTFNLNTITNYPVGANYSVQFFENNSAIPNTTAINNGQTKNFTITVTTNAGVVPACTFTKNFSISYLSFPSNNTVYSSNPLCVGTTNYSTSDFKNKFFPNSTFQFQFSTDGINFNLNTINPQTNNTVFVKITEPNYTCQSIVQLNFVFNPAVVANQPNPNNPNFQQCASATQYFDLTQIFSEINPNPNVTISFHRTLADAQTGANAVSYQFRSGLGFTTLYIRVVDNTTGCVAQNFPQITLLVYLKPKIISTNPIVLKNCAGNTVFNLTQNSSNITNAQAPVVTTMQYFSQNGTLLTGTQIANYDASILGTKPYMSISYNPTCGDAVYFDLQYYPKPFATTTQIPICSVNSYSLSDFENKIIANSSNYSFSDANGNPLPANFNVSLLPLMVQVLIKDNSTGCVSDIQNISFVQGNPTSILTNSTIFSNCDVVGDLFDGITSFNLDLLKTNFTADANATFEYFSDANLTQSIAANYTNTNAFAQTIYARITSSGFCPTIVSINLIVNIPTKSSTLLPNYLICYGDNLLIDGGSENVKWQWSTGETTQIIYINKAGNYSVKLTNFLGCSYTQNIVVSDINQPVIDQINQSNTQIEVIASGGIAPYEYSFDSGVTWQTSNILLNPNQSSYEIHVRSSNGCLGIPKFIYFIKINNTITPNNDRINDTWTVDNLDKMENIEIVITDRFGKTVFSTSDKNNIIWNGKSGDRLLSTDTYWYGVKWYDPSTKKSETRQGWILLKNRN